MNRSNTIKGLIESCIDSRDVNIEKAEDGKRAFKENNIYVITNNAVVDDEIDYSIYGVATDINEAKKIFNQAVKDAKTDSDFENLDAIEENSPDFKNNDGEWIYSESDDSFELWCNGEYNSNNYSIQIKKYELDKEKELSDEYEL